MARRTRREATETASEILDVAERMVRVRGFNGFSYADVAGELGVTTAALHYHFVSKAELGEALVARYATRFGEALAGIDARVDDPSAKLDAYAGLYHDVLRDQRMCLCGMLAADYQTLPPQMRGAVVRFFDDNEDWLVRVLEEGKRNGSMRFAGSAAEAAQMIVGGLEGAMLVARPYGDTDRFRAAAARLVASVTSR